MYHERGLTELFRYGNPAMAAGERTSGLRYRSFVPCTQEVTYVHTPAHVRVCACVCVCVCVRAYKVVVSPRSFLGASKHGVMFVDVRQHFILSSERSWEMARKISLQLASTHSCVCIFKRAVLWS